MMYSLNQVVTNETKGGGSMTTSVADKPYLKIKSLIALKGTNQKESIKQSE